MVPLSLKNMSNSFANIKILVVDDEELLREVLSETFELHGAKVDSAESGRAALELVKKNNYDVIITDIRMPDGDGITLLENINKLNKPIPKLFVCSAYNDLTAEKVKKIGISKVFIKPFDLNDLLKGVVDFLDT